LEIVQLEVALDHHVVMLSVVLLLLIQSAVITEVDLMNFIYQKNVLKIEIEVEVEVMKTTEVMEVITEVMEVTTEVMEVTTEVMEVTTEVGGKSGK